MRPEFSWHAEQGFVADGQKIGKTGDDCPEITAQSLKGFETNVADITVPGVPCLFKLSTEQFVRFENY